MPKIHQLADHIVAQIAAGEVIERPAYAVKELLENAIDARADHIQIFLEEAGLKKIMIIDNGHGMSLEDLRESYKHHTTSKLNESLIGIKSFGFRGEALSSIAAISSLSIKSRTSEASAGTMIELHGGVVIKESTTGMPPGTTIIISDLFRTVPARKKFLKSQRTEFRRCLDVILQTAVAYPHIRIELSHNNRKIIDFPRTTDRNERIKYLFGSDVVEHMIPINSTKSFITISGYIGSPHVTSTTSVKQFLFINNRSITDRTINQIIKDAYGNLLSNNAYPLFALLISVPHEMVDVNVHPRKEQIAFMNSGNILSGIKEILETTIKESNVTYIPSIWNKKRTENMPAYATNILRDAITPWGTKNISLVKISDITQMHNLYITTQTYNGMLLIDQHAAHERILYEEYSMAFRHEKDNTQVVPVNTTIIISTPPETADLLIEHTKTLSNFGFIFEEFGQDAIKITHIPLIFKDHDIPALFNEVLNELQNERNINVDTQSQKMLAYLACRNAIKAGDILTKKQCKELLEKLEKTPNSFTCPHGRPTKVELPLRDIHKYFKRT
jgi:DNA mismatch repair protein MutL